MSVHGDEAPDEIPSQPPPLESVAERLASCRIPVARVLDPSMSRLSFDRQEQQRQKTDVRRASHVDDVGSLDLAANRREVRRCPAKDAQLVSKVLTPGWTYRMESDSIGGVRESTCGRGPTVKRGYVNYGVEQVGEVIDLTNGRAQPTMPRSAE